jgi:hypothetical protein
MHNQNLLGVTLPTFLPLGRHYTFKKAILPSLTEVSIMLADRLRW